MDFDLHKALQYFQTVVTRHYTDFRGRVSRRDFWTYIAVYVALALIVAIAQGLVGISLLSVLHFALLLPTTAMVARRLQDTGKNGVFAWFMTAPLLTGTVIAFLAGLTLASGLFLLPLLLLLSAISLVAMVGLIYLCVQPGTAGPNTYGPQPQQRREVAR
jgi:uncharacterized membrane protein YhaH (DUF805 family)